MNDLTRTQIPLAGPNIGEREVELVIQALRSGTLSIGPMVAAFERAIADLAGRRHGVACSSGTAGLHMAVRALGIGEGDEVITTPFSFVASANCALYERAIPRFVDIEEDSLGLNPEQIESAVSPRTRAIVPVHVFGNPCRIVEIAELSRRFELVLIEDSCEALGSAIDRRPLGSFGDASVFAFYPNKQITTGEGGMVVVDRDDLAAELVSMRNQGRDSESTWLRHVRLGFNYRLDELSAALGVAQVERLAEMRRGRESVVRAYGERLGGLEWLTTPRSDAGASVDWFVYVVRLAEKLDRDRIIDQLAQDGVAARAYFSPLHLQPFYQREFGYRAGDFPIAERVARTTLALPFSSVMTESMVEFVCERLREAVDAQSGGRP